MRIRGFIRLRAAGIPEDDFRGMLRLVSKVQLSRSELLARWRIVLDGLCRLVRADVGVKTQIAATLAERERWINCVVDYGSPTEDEQARLVNRFERLESVTTSDRSGKGASQYQSIWYDHEDPAYANEHVLVGICQAPQRGFFMAAPRQCRLPGARAVADRCLLLGAIVTLRIDTCVAV